MALPELIANTDGPIAELTATAEPAATVLHVAAPAPAVLQGAGQFRAVLGSDQNGEIVLVTAGANTLEWTVVRGAEGTTAIQHKAGAPVFHDLTAGGLRAATVTPDALAAETTRAQAAEAFVKSALAAIEATTVDLAAYGGVGDTRTVQDGAMGNGSAVLKSKTAAFTAEDVGKTINVQGAASAATKVLSTTIASVQGTEEATLAVAATETVANAEVVFGTDNSPALQAAYGATGGQGIIQVGGGNFMLGSKGALQVQRGIAGVVIEGAGRGATTFYLSAGAPRFLDFVKIEDHDTFQNVELCGFRLDGQMIGGQSHVLMGNYGSTERASHMKRVRLDKLSAHDIDILNVPNDPTFVNSNATPNSQNRVPVGFYIYHAEQGEATQDWFTNLRFDRVNCAVKGSKGGGNAGFVMIGLLESLAAGPGANIFYDNVESNDCRWDTGTTPPNFYLGSGMQIGSRAFGRRARVRNFHAKNGGDDLIEVNNCADAIMENCTGQDSWNEAFMTVNFTQPWVNGSAGNAEQGPPTGQIVVWRNCRGTFSPAQASESSNFRSFLVGNGESTYIPIGTVIIDGGSYVSTNTMMRRTGTGVVCEGVQIERLVIKDFTHSHTGGSMAGAGEHEDGVFRIAPAGNSTVVIDNLKIRENGKASGGHVVKWRGVQLDSFQNLVTKATLTEGSPEVTVNDTTLLKPGLEVTGTGIPGGTTIEAIPSFGKIKLSQAATAKGSQTLTFLNATPGVARFEIDGITCDWNIATSEGSSQAGISSLVNFGYLGSNPNVSGVIRRVVINSWEGDEKPRPVYFRKQARITDRLDLEHCDFTNTGAGGSNVFFEAGGETSGKVFNGIGNRWYAGATPAGVEGAVGSSLLQAGAVTAAAIANEAVTGAKIANATIEAAQLAAGSVIEAKLAAEAVTAAKIKNEAVTEPKIANSAVTTAKIAAEAVTAGKLALEAVGEAQIKNAAVTSGKIAAEAILTGKLANEAVTAEKIKTGAVGATQLAGEAVTEGKLGPEAVGATKIKAEAVTEPKLANSAVSSVKIAAEAVTAAKLAKEAVGEEQIKNAAVTSGKIAAEAVLEGKLANEAVTAAKIKNAAVTEAKLAGEAVTNGKLANEAVTAPKIKNEAVTAEKLAKEAVTASRLLAPPAKPAKPAEKGTEPQAEAHPARMITIALTGDGATTKYKVKHSFATRLIHVSVQKTEAEEPGELEPTSAFKAKPTSASEVEVTFGAAPGAGVEFFITVVG